jgi:hypothetical protein
MRYNRYNRKDEKYENKNFHTEKNAENVIISIREQKRN